MAGFTRFVDLALTDDDKIDAIKPMPINDQPDYSYGTRVVLGPAELDKLEAAGLDVSEIQEGETLDLRGLATVTWAKTTGEGRRVELQIEKLAIEVEDDEDVDD